MPTNNVGKWSFVGFFILILFYLYIFYFNIALLFLWMSVSVHYSIVIEEKQDGKWVPFKADDVQLEFIMLDPYYRVNLKNDGKGNFSVTFKYVHFHYLFLFIFFFRLLMIVF